MSPLSFCLFVCLAIAANAQYKDEHYDGDFTFGQYAGAPESDMYFDYLFGEPSQYHGKASGIRYPVPPRPYRWPLGGAYPFYPSATAAPAYKTVYTYASTAAPTAAPSTVAPTTVAPTTEAPTTDAPTTEAPTTLAPTTEGPTTVESITVEPTTAASLPETTPRPISMILNGPRMQVILTV